MTSSMSVLGDISDFVALLSGGTIKNLVIDSSVTINLSGNYIGDIAGKNSGTIYNCVNNGNISVGQESGGIAGRNFGAIENCSTTG